MLRSLFREFFYDLRYTVVFFAFAANVYCAYNFWTTWPAIWSDPSGFYTHERELQALREWLFISSAVIVACAIFADEMWFVFYACAALIVIQGLVLAIAAILFITVVGVLVIGGHPGFLELIGWSVGTSIVTCAASCVIMIIRDAIYRYMPRR